jgi:SAM-dependent methyltransferase
MPVVLDQPGSAGRVRAAGLMRRDWDARAAADPLYFIDATRGGQRYEEFYARGPGLVARIVDPARQHLGAGLTAGRVLEIGCGMGRLFAGLAERFGEVWGIDISARMVSLGRRHCPVPATWLIGDGMSLGGVPGASIDHVLSFEVFQHIPDPRVIDGYFAEISRVLAPGGTFQVQLRSGSDSRQQAAVRALPRALRVTAGRVADRARVARIRGDIDTWLGCVVPPAKAAAMAGSHGLTDPSVLPDDVHPRGMGYWLIGRAAG